MPKIHKKDQFDNSPQCLQLNLTAAVFNFYLTRPKPQIQGKHLSNSVLPTDIENYDQHSFEFLDIPLHKTLVSGKKRVIVFCLNERESCDICTDERVL